MGDQPLNLLTLPDKPLLKILRMISTKDNLHLAASCRTLHGRLWSDILAPEVFTQVAQRDYGSSLVARESDRPTAGDQQIPAPLVTRKGKGAAGGAGDSKTASFFYFLRCARGILMKLYLPSEFLHDATGSLLCKFPVTSLTEIDVLVEQGAMAALAGTVFRRIPSVKTVTLRCKNMADETSGLDMAPVFATIGSYCPRVENFGFIGWKDGIGANSATKGIGEKSEKALVQKLIRRLPRLKGLDLTDSYLTPGTIKAILDLANVQRGLQHLHCSYGVDPGDLSGLSRCPNLRSIHYVSYKPVNPDMFRGLRNLETLHMVTRSSGNDPCLMQVMGDSCRSLKRVTLQFSGIYNTTDNIAKKLIATHPNVEALVLRDIRNELSDASLLGMQHLSKLRLISCQSTAITGHFLDAISPGSNPALELVFAGISHGPGLRSVPCRLLEKRLRKRGKRVWQFAPLNGCSLFTVKQRKDNYHRRMREIAATADCDDLLCCLEWRL